MIIFRERETKNHMIYDRFYNNGSEIEFDKTLKQKIEAYLIVNSMSYPINLNLTKCLFYIIEENTIKIIDIKEQYQLKDVIKKVEK